MQGDQAKGVALLTNGILDLISPRASERCRQSVSETILGIFHQSRAGIMKPVGLPPVAISVGLT